MEARTLGRTGLDVTVLSFGCGAVGGLMTKGDPKDQERAFARALEVGIRYFDTAPHYGNGASETNVGRILAAMKPKLWLGTKVRLKDTEYGRIGARIAESIDESLKRLGRSDVDVYYLHNRICDTTEGDGMKADLVLNEVVPAFDKLKRAGKIRYTGITALGDTGPLLRVVESNAFDVAQICYNALNPTAGPVGGKPLPKGFPGQDYEGLLDAAGAQRMGSVGIRVLAGGALSGTMARHVLSAQDVAPLGSGPTYGDDVDRANAFRPLIDRGYVRTLPELALRFAIHHRALSTTLVGMATFDEFEQAFAACEKGPLPAEALAEVAKIQSGFASAS